jgi:collagen type III alpha
LFNPTEEFWFSEGFLVAPPSEDSPDPYIPTSGGQVVEFVPPALSASDTFRGSGDAAEIGVGPDSVKSCFRFNFYGASLGCAALPSEGWCEFDISAYAYDPVSSQEQPISWSETKRVPACPTFPNGPCALTPVDLDGYTNVTSILITMRVGLELRVWWGDDFRFGWSDDSCAAAQCRAGSPPQRVKRETLETALRRGVWQWTPSGLERLSDDYVWDARY